VSGRCYRLFNIVAFSSYSGTNELWRVCVFLGVVQFSEGITKIFEEDLVIVCEDEESIGNSSILFFGKQYPFRVSVLLARELLVHVTLSV